jgi:hypothetical protein
MPQKVYTLPEAAEFLRIPEWTFRKYRPQVGGSKLGKRWLFTETELLGYLESKRHKPVQDLQSA